MSRMINKVKGKIAVFVVLAISMFGAIAMVPVSQANAAENGVNMEEACTMQWGAVMDVRLVENNVMGWRCHWYGTNGQVFRDVDVNYYCRTKWPGSSSHYRNFNDPYSWYCS